MAKGKFIVLEGMVGCGKTTQRKIVQSYLYTKGYDIFAGREPGSSPAAEKIRDIVLSSKYKIDPLAEVMLFEAARADYIAKEILPKLASGATCITDRSFPSTLAFQGYGKGINIEQIKILNQWAMHGIEPDMIFILDVDNIQAALIRARKSSVETGEEDKFEAMDLEYHKRVRDGYREIARNTHGAYLISSHEAETNIESRIGLVSKEILRHLKNYFDAI